MTAPGDDVVSEARRLLEICAVDARVERNDAWSLAAFRVMARLLARIEELEAQREAVLSVHVMQEYHASSEDYAGSWECYSCGEDWPCATVTALTPGPS